AYLTAGRLEEGDGVGPVLVAQVERLDLLGEPLVRPAALVVELDDLEERRLAPVVHVGRRPRDVPQRRGLARAPAGVHLGATEPTPVGIGLVHADAQAVGRLPGELGAGGARHAGSRRT